MTLIEITMAAIYRDVAICRRDISRFQHERLRPLLLSTEENEEAGFHQAISPRRKLKQYIVAMAQNH